MAKKTVTDIAREQGVSEAEVKQKLDEAGAAAPTDDLVDDDDVRRAFGVKATIKVVVGKVPGEVVLTNNSATYSAFFTLP